MFQPEVKLEFIRRYCSSADGWVVMMDIDPSEEGRTGGARRSEEAKQRQEEMVRSAQRVRKAATQLGIEIVGNRAQWFAGNGFPVVPGDRDIVAIHPEERTLLIVEVEGASSGQPEQKLYKAIGQIVLALGKPIPDGWTRSFVLAVHGDAIARNLNDAHALARFGVSGISLAEEREHDVWAFGRKPQFLQLLK